MLRVAFRRPHRAGTVSGALLLNRLHRDYRTPYRPSRKHRFHLYQLRPDWEDLGANLPSQIQRGFELEALSRELKRIYSQAAIPPLLMGKVLCDPPLSMMEGYFAEIYWQYWHDGASGQCITWHTLA